MVNRDPEISIALELSEKAIILFTYPNTVAVILIFSYSRKVFFQIFLFPLFPLKLAFPQKSCTGHLKILSKKALKNRTDLVDSMLLAYAD